MFRRLAAALGSLLVLFHLWVFGSQLVDGRLTELGPAVRWVLAAGLVVALGGLHRAGVSLVRGRQAICLWLLVGLLHGPAVAGSLPERESPALAEVVISLVQAVAAVAFGLGVAVTVRRARRVVAPRAVIARAPGRRRRAADTRRVLPSSSRPPPALVPFAF